MHYKERVLEKGNIKEVFKKQKKSLKKLQKTDLTQTQIRNWGYVPYTTHGKRTYTGVCSKPVDYRYINASQLNSVAHHATGSG